MKDPTTAKRILFKKKQFIYLLYYIFIKKIMKEKGVER